MPRIPVDCADDVRLADYQTVRDPKLLRERGVFVAESREVVRILLDETDFTVRSLLVTQSAFESLGETIAGLHEDIPIYVGTRDLMERVIGYDIHRGCLAMGVRQQRLALAELAGKDGVLVLLDAVSNPDNVGSVFRNALGFGAAGVVIGPRCADPLYRKSIRTSMGAALRLPFTEATDWNLALDDLRHDGWLVAALTLDADAIDIDVFLKERPRRLAWVLGNEGEGVGAVTRAAADVRVRIPIAGAVDSLNVATTSGIALYLSSRSRNADRTGRRSNGP